MQKSMQYLPHYDRHTGIPMGSYPTKEDVQARLKMISDAGLQIMGEMWDPGNGNVPIYEGPELADDQLQILCLKKLVEKDAISDLLQEYQKEYLRVNHVGISVSKINNHKVMIGGNEFPAKKLDEFIARLKEKADFGGQGKK